MLHGVRLLFRHHKFCTRVQLVMHRNALSSTGRVATGLLVEARNPVWIAFYRRNREGCRYQKKPEQIVTIAILATDFCLLL